jgi:hypothetical protein
MKNIPVLITSVAQPIAPFVAMADPAKRIHSTIESLKHWALISPGLDIIICDGSGYDFQELISSIPLLKTLNIEVLHFFNDLELVKNKGKGYGEGEIIAYALNHSEILNKHDTFSKCTAKYWVNNYQECVYGHQKNISIEKYYDSRYSLKFQACDTRFYIVAKDFYLTKLVNSHKAINDFESCFLENVFARDLILSEIVGTEFKIKPLIYGMSGTTGEFSASRPESVRKKILRMIRRKFT